MQERIEPPVLLSRLLMFVFAGTAVVLFVMVMTLDKMFPLNRPEIFFITTKPESAATIRITEMPPSSASLDNFKQAFVLEYIRARNEVEKNVSIMRQRWSNPDGIMATWSTEDVYEKFQTTALYRTLTTDYPDFDFSCHVDILKKPLPTNREKTMYKVEFEYYCNGGQEQTQKKTYEVRVGLDMNPGGQVQWRERLGNPLGITVSKYIVESGAGDPLDTIHKQ